MRSILYFFKEAIQGFARNFSTAIGSVVTIFLSLMIIGVFLVAGSVLERLMTSVEDEVSITAYVSDEAADDAISEVMEDLQANQYVANVSFTTKEEAWENFSNSTSSDIADALEDYNPLPASIDIELNDPQMVESVADELAANSTYISICEDSSNVTDSIKYGQETVEKLFEVTNYVRYIGLALIVILIFIALVFINNTIRLAILARRKEIAIMRLVGASNGFIRGPFLMEGALHALIGSILAVVVIQLLRFFAIPTLQESIKFLDFSVDAVVYFWISVALVAAGLVIGLFGSAFAMRRYLKV